MSVELRVVSISFKGPDSAIAGVLEQAMQLALPPAENGATEYKDEPLDQVDRFEESKEEVEVIEDEELEDSDFVVDSDADSDAEEEDTADEEEPEFVKPSRNGLYRDAGTAPESTEDPKQTRTANPAKVIAQHLAVTGPQRPIQIRAATGVSDGGIRGALMRRPEWFRKNEQGQIEITQAGRLGLQQEV